MTAAEAAPQGPEFGAMRRRLGRFYFTGVFWYRFQHWAAGWCPYPLVALSVYFFGTLFFLLLGGVRRSLRENHALVDPSASWWARTWRAYRTVITLSWCLAERYRQFHARTAPEFRFVGVANWEAARQDGRGFILVTSHIGGWELGSAVPSSVGDRPIVHVVREPEADPVAQAFVLEQVERLGDGRFRTHFAGTEGEQELSLELYRALRDGEIVALQGDRPRQGGHVVRVPFLGSEVSLPPGPAQLARLAGAPLLPVFTFRDGFGRYQVNLREPIQVARTRDRLADVREATERLAAEIEWAIRERPTQWFCFRDVTAYVGEEATSKKVESSPSATSSPETLETSKR